MRVLPTTADFALLYPLYACPGQVGDLTPTLERRNERLPRLLLALLGEWLAMTGLECAEGQSPLGGGLGVSPNSLSGGVKSADW